MESRGRRSVERKTLGLTLFCFFFPFQNEVGMKEYKTNMKKRVFSDIVKVYAKKDESCKYKGNGRRNCLK